MDRRDILDLMTPETPEGWRFKWAMEGVPAMLMWLGEIKQAVADPVVVERKRRAKRVETDRSTDVAG